MNEENTFEPLSLKNWKPYIGAGKISCNEAITIIEKLLYLQRIKDSKISENICKNHYCEDGCGFDAQEKILNQNNND